MVKKRGRMNELEKREQELKEFLQAHPKARAMQEELDRVLSKCKPEERLEVVFLMMTGHFVELLKEFDKLSTLLAKCKQKPRAEDE
jgi:hypothetical protein